MEQENKPRSTLERLENAERLSSELSAKLNYVFSVLTDFNKRLASSEQVCVSLGKALAATTVELLENKVIDSLKVMERMRDADDKEEKGKIQSLLRQGLIKTAEVVGPDSLVAVSQKDMITYKNGEQANNLISNYRLLEMSASYTTQAARDVLIGKKIGDTFETDKTEHDNSTAVLLATILEIYDFAEVKKKVNKHNGVENTILEKYD